MLLAALRYPLVFEPVRVAASSDAHHRDRRSIHGWPIVNAGDVGGVAVAARGRGAVVVDQRIHLRGREQRFVGLYPTVEHVPFHEAGRQMSLRVGNLREVGPRRQLRGVDDLPQFARVRVFP